MKKIISVILIGIMLISTLTGCGVNELGYFNLSKEISSITQYGFNNKTSMEISKELADEEYKIDFDINGEVNMDNLNDLYGTMDFTFKINDVEIENPINIKFVDNKLYISKNALIEIVKYEKMLNGTEEYGKVVEKLYNNDLKDIEYIVYEDLSEEFVEIPNEIPYAEIYESAYEYLAKAFKGFDSKLVKKINNGYSIELTPESTLEFLRNLVTYICVNKETVYDETMNYIENVYSILGEEISQEEKNEIVEEMEASRQDFYDFIDEAALYFEEFEELKEYSNLLNGSIIKQDISKENESYKEVTSAEIIYDDISMGKLLSTTRLTPKEVEKVPVTGNTIALEEMEKILEKVENEVNPVQKVELQWYANSSDTQVNKYRLNGATNWDYQPFVIIEDRVYLPLRYIGESFGEDVDWDNVNKKAFVIRGEEKIDMTGLLVESRTMIKIRDFEKLGYKIEYNQVDGLSTATIIK